MMDRMSKLVAGRLKAQAPTGPHPAPELLSAFVENALSETERAPLLQHLGACSDCREILYLASPDSPETQKVLVPQPRPFTFRRWIFGWGALAASLAVVLVFFTSSRLAHKSDSAKVAATPASANGSTVANENESGAKIAADKTPPELDRLRTRDAVKVESVQPKAGAVLEKSERAPQREAKHMTAKPQATMNFDESGQVHVSAPKSSAVEGAPQLAATPNAETAARSLSVQGRNVNAPAVSIANTSPAVPPSPVAATVVKNSVGAADSRVDQFARKSIPGNLNGTVLDSSGAVVANAKVTLIGAGGQKSAVSDSSGRFSFATVAPGPYSLKAEANGFKATDIPQVAVLDDKPAALRVTLDVGTSSEVVEVTGASTAVSEVRAKPLSAADASSGYVAQTASQDFGMASAKAANAQMLKDAKVMSGRGVQEPQWTLSPAGEVQSSGDGGKTWQPVSVGNRLTFHALSAVGPDIWVAGKAGILYHSSDSGQTWVKVEPTASGRKLDQDIVHVDFSDPLHGTVNTANNEVWSTSDGGKTWLLK